MAGAPASGAPFRIGITTVTCTTPDNLAHITTGTFMVTVNTPAAPVLTLPALSRPPVPPHRAPVSGSVIPVGVTLLVGLIGGMQC